MRPRVRSDGRFPRLFSKPRPRNKRALTAGAAVGLLLLVGGAAQMPGGRPTPTGLEVPRWVSLKSEPVRARYGPGLDHRILWEYRAAGLPVQVIAETREWRKICDPEGSVAWIHRTVASGRRTVFNTADEETPVRARPEADAPMRARLRPRSLATLEDCADGWCRIRAGRVRGWAEQSALFGVQAAPLCSASAPAGPGEGRG